MRDHPCVVCGGSQILRVEVKVPLNWGEAVAAFKTTYRTYPCPECAPTTGLERVHIVEYRAEVDGTYEEDPRFMDHVKHEAAHRIIDELLRSGHITVTRGKTLGLLGTFTVRSRVGVVSARHVASIEERVQQGMEPFARKLIEALNERFQNWGNERGWFYHIDKVALRPLMESVLREVLEERMKPL